MNWLWHMLGTSMEGATRLREVTWVWRPVIGPAWLVLVALVLGGLAVWAYRRYRAELGGWRWGLLAGLRVLSLLLVLGLLCRPSLELSVETQVRRALVFLFDGSSSMAIPDGQVARLEKVRGLLEQKSSPLPQLAREFDLVGYRFGRGLEELEVAEPAGWAAQLRTNSNVSAIGEAVREVLRRKRGQPLAGIVLLSDGANNAGSAPREVALLAGEEGVPLFVHGVGRQLPKDVVVSGLLVQELVFAGDEVPVTVRVRGQGLAGRTSTVALRVDGQVLDQQNISFTDEAEQVVTLRYKPTAKGDYVVSVGVDGFADEVVQENNVQAQSVRVVEDRIKVLLVEQAPRWEWHYLQALLLRDKRIALKCLLVEADPGIATGPDSPYLEQFPADKETLLGYDLVLWGDVDPKLLSSEQLENLGRFVAEFGGALVMVAGKRFNPQAYRRTVLERLCPVEFESLGLENGPEPSADQPIQLELTATGRRNPMLRLADTEAENLARWAELPPVYWLSRVSRAKPGAEVLVVEAESTDGPTAAKRPVLALHQYGLGHVLFVGTDNTWRWRKNVGDRHYVRFWGQLVQRLALTHLLGDAKRTQLSADRQNYHTGDRVSVYARLYTSSYTPVTEDQVRGYYRNRSASGPGADAATEVILRPMPAQPGMYRGEFVAPSAGQYEFHLDRDQETQLDFTVRTPPFEMGETAMNESLLREMAQLSRGQYLEEKDWAGLPGILRTQQDQVLAKRTAELWASPLSLLLVVFVLGSEWALRKLFHLK